MKEDEWGGTCVTNGRDKKCIQNFERKILRENAIWEV